MNSRIILLRNNFRENKYREPVKLKSAVKTKQINPAKIDYYKKVWEISESQELEKLTNFELRGISHALDHIIPITYGFKNNVAAEIIGNINNLRFISFKENLLKSSQITSEVKDKISEFEIA